MPEPRTADESRTSPPHALVSAWRDQRQWSIAADGLKKALTDWSLRVLGLGAIGAALQTAASQAGGWGLPSIVATVLSGLGAAALGLSALAVSTKLGMDARRGWIYARAVSEAIKSEIYGFLALSAEARSKDRIDALSAGVHKIKQDAQDLQSRVAAFDPDDKELPSFEGVAGYMSKRVTDQIDGYYRKAAKTAADRADGFRRLHFRLAIAATLLGATATVVPEATQPQIAAWVAVITTIASSVAAHAAAGRHDFLAISYSATAAELEHLRDTFEPSTATPAEAGRFVERCESVISVQNQTWMGKVPKAA